MATIVDYIPFCYNSRYSSNREFNSDWYRGPDLNKFRSFSKFVKVNLTEDIIEVPCIYKYVIGYALKDNFDREKLNLPPLEELYIPMMAGHEDPVVVRGSAPAIKKFFKDTPPSCNLVKKKVGDFIYYGGEGIILYEDLTPLVMFTLKIRRDPANDYKYIPVRPIVYINPAVYSNDDILSKYVRGKLISGCVDLRDRARRGILYMYNRHIGDPFNIFSNNLTNYDFQIVIEDFEHFFTSPTIPDTTFNSEKINSMLSDDLDDILLELKTKESSARAYVSR